MLRVFDGGYTDRVLAPGRGITLFRVYAHLQRFKKIKKSFAFSSTYKKIFFVSRFHTHITVLKIKKIKYSVSPK